MKVVATLLYNNACEDALNGVLLPEEEELPDGA